jgi:hypothetical protein
MGAQTLLLFWLLTAAGAAVLLHFLLPAASYPGHMYVAAHVWQLQKVKGFAAAAAAAAAGAGSEFDTPVQHAVHTSPVAAQQTQQQQQQHGTADECRLYVGPGTSGAGLRGNNTSRRPGTADASHGATDEFAADLLDTESDASSLISSLESEEVVHVGRHELEYESDDEDEDKRVNAREKMGGAVFATHPHAKWLAGFRGKGAAQQQQQQKEVAVRLNKKLLEKHQQLQQQQQQIGLEEEPLLGTEMPAEAAAAAGDSAGIQSAAAEDKAAADDAAAAAAAELAAEPNAGDAGDTHSEHCMRQQLLGIDTGMEAATGAGTLSGYFAGCADCTACASNVRLVVPLHSSAFNYRPTRSVMRRKRLMMQQVGLGFRVRCVVSCLTSWCDGLGMWDGEVLTLRHAQLAPMMQQVGLGHTGAAGLFCWGCGDGELRSLQHAQRLGC